MSEALTRELPNHVSRMYRVALASLMVGIAWLLLPAMSARAESPNEGAQSAASNVGDVHAAPPSVLVLPPRLPAGANDTVRAAAEAACDRLAQDIAATGLARVVDRTQLDRILQERNLQAEPSRPMLSYDAMIRLEADTTRLAPETMLSLIDLSTGNIIAQRAFTWPPREAAAKPMLDFCRDVLKSWAKPAAGKLRVRTLWAVEAIPNERMRPLGRRLIEVFEEALRRSERIVFVQHLEAGTAKEESLLLLMGMSRLPGERQFTPQADATIELRIDEGDGQGKTFPETPVEIGVRLREGADYEGQWMTTTGLVRDFDMLVPLVWQRLSESLSEVHAETAGTLLNEISLRRKQAEAELLACPALDAARWNLPALHARLAHAEAALKLDPTYPEAAASYVGAFEGLCVYYHFREHLSEAPEALRTLREAARHMDRFRQNGNVCGALCTSGHECMVRSRLYRLMKNDNGPLKPVTKETVAIGPEWAQGLDALKQLLERALEDDVRFLPQYATEMIVVVHRGMRLLDVPAAQRQVWLEKVYRRFYEKFTRAWKPGPIRGEWHLRVDAQIRIAELFVEDGRTDRAKQILLLAMERPVDYDCMMGSYTPCLMGEVIKNIGDARLLADFNGWLAHGNYGEKAHRLYIQWPEVKVFAQMPYRDPRNPKAAGPGLVPLYVRAGPPPYPVSNAECAPLAEGDGRLYVLLGSEGKNAVACVPVDDHGRPIGKAAPDMYGYMTCNNIKSIVQPKLSVPASFRAKARYLDGKLFVTSEKSGLLVFDPKTETWKVYGPEQGLPEARVESFFHLGPDMLYGVSPSSQYLLNLADGSVTLLDREIPGQRRFPLNVVLRSVWRSGDRLMVADRDGIWTDVLGMAPKRAELSRVTCYGWAMSSRAPFGITSMTEAAGRRFCNLEGTLYEIDAVGRTVRAWSTGGYISPADRDDSVRLIAPADCPLPNDPGFELLAAGSRLVITGNNQWFIVYDLNSDTWYGPIEWFGVKVATPSGGLWQAGLCHLSLDDVMAYAKTIGRAMTTAEYRQRRDEFIAAAKPLDRGKFALAMRQFDRAEAAFQQTLDAEPNQPEALLLMGFLHDCNCLNRPDKAIEYYRRLAELEDNRSASFTGMYFWLCVLQDRRQWTETLALCEKTLQLYPDLVQCDTQRIEAIRDQSRQQLAEKGAKQPAAGTSNKEERPAD